jgi:hypothetical protein
MHPDPPKWIKFVDGSLTGTKRQTMEDHLVTCEECRGTEERVRRVLSSLALGPPETPSNSALQAALGAIESPLPTGLPTGVRELAQRFVRLVADSLAQPDLVFAGARSASLARRLRFEADDLELDVLVESRGDRRRVMAQLLSLGADLSPISDANIFVSTGGRLAATGVTDDCGQLFSEIDGAGPIEICVVARNSIARFRIPDARASL